MPIDKTHQQLHCLSQNISVPLDKFLGEELTRCIKCYVSSQGRLLGRQCFQPEIWVVTTITDQVAVIDPDQLTVTDRLEDGTIEGLQALCLGRRGPNKDMIDGHREWI